MVSLKHFVEDLREEKRRREDRRLTAFTLVLTALFLALSIWASAI